MSCYTTSEYVSKLKKDKARSIHFSHNMKDFAIFKSKEEAEKDAQFIQDLYKKEGKKVRKPTIYKIRFEPVK